MRFTPLIIATAMTGADVSLGQEVLHELTGTFDFGHAVCGAIDFDQDGRDDITVGWPTKEHCSGNTGSVQAFSSVDQVVLHTWNPLWFANGFDVNVAGDVDQDGFVDLVLTAPDNHYDCPYADLLQVISGSSGAAIWSSPSGTGVAEPVASGVGDVNQDGFGDVLRGDPVAGKAWVLSGATGLKLYQYSEPAAEFGSSVTDVGDLNLDGQPDYAVGARSGFAAGLVRIYNGANGVPMAVLNGVATGEWFGAAMDHVGDLDVDGYPELVVGAPRAPVNGQLQVGVARVISGQSLNVVRVVEGDAAFDRFGRAVTRQLDFDGDGTDDFAVGSDGGYATVLSGATALEIETYHADGMAGRFGTSVDGRGDVNGDGRGDLIIGSRSSAGACPRRHSPLARPRPRTTATCRLPPTDAGRGRA